MPTWLRVVLLVLAVAAAVTGSVRYQSAFVRRLVRGADGRLGRVVLRLVGTYVLVLVVAAVLAGVSVLLWDLAQPVSLLLCAVAVAALGPFALIFLGSAEFTTSGPTITDEVRTAGAGTGQARVIALLGGGLCLVTLGALLTFGIVLAAVE